MDLLRRKIIVQAASSLLQRSMSMNFNTNAFVQRQRQRKYRKKVRRTEKCHLWLRNPSMTFSTNAIDNEIRPMMLIHKKRFRRDEFLSSMQNCLQPPFSSNHFYAFDQLNLLKLQQKSVSVEDSTSKTILNQLEKILELCGQLRSAVKDVECSDEKNIIDIHPELNREENDLRTTETKSQTNIRKPEDLCRCFLENFFEKNSSNETPLNSEEEEYLSELTRAYLLGREHSQKEQNPIIVEQTTSTDEKNNNNNDTNIVSPSISSINFKHDRFLHQPIGTKTTDVLPGIGSKYANLLSECGFDKVRRLLGFYLMIKNDQEFVQWLKNNVKISTHSAFQCTNALRAWCQEHL